MQQVNPVIITNIDTNDQSFFCDKNTPFKVLDMYSPGKLDIIIYGTLKKFEPGRKSEQNFRRY